MPRETPKKEDQERLADTNMENYGGKEHKELKKAAAETEPAWAEAGKNVGLQVWRIEKFQVRPWDKSSYGKFYTGDAYIVLDTYHPKGADGKESDKLAYDVHFWLGKESTQDEQGTAAYKTVELDDYLDDLPVQYRQVQGHESKEFLQLWGTIQYLEGGIESGFNKVKPTEYKPKLFHIHGVNSRFVRVDEVPLARDSLNMGDVFVLDGGLQLYQWNGTDANIWEKRKGNELVKRIEQERLGKAKTTVLDGLEDDDGFWPLLGGKGDIKPGETKAAPAAAAGGKGPAADKAGVMGEAPKTEEDDWDPACLKELYRAEADEKGGYKFTPVCVAGDPVLSSKLDTNGVFVLDVDDQDHEHHVYVWCGAATGREALRNALKVGDAFIKEFELPTSSNVVRLAEGRSQRDIGFRKAFDA